MSVILQEVGKFPLEGTDRQIQWASSLRHKAAGTLAKAGNRAVLREIRPLLVEAEVRVMNCFTPEGLGLLATLTAIQALSHKEARWWIDKRDEDPMKWLRPAYGEVSLHCLKFPPLPRTSE